MLKTVPGAASEAAQQRLESILAQSAFEGLRTILDRLSEDRTKLCVHLKEARDYTDLLARLGYKVTLVKQIHLQDCYSRMSPAGGIKAVLPYNDIPTQSSLPTLVHYDSSVTTTPKAATFFNAMFADLRKQLGGK